MKRSIINKELINRVTKKVAIREKAFFAVMRQSGLSAVAICKLRIRNIESRTIIPCKIKIGGELGQSKTKKIPYFIGEEAKRYLTQYLATRTGLTGESYLFATKNGNKPLSPKNVTRTFTNTLKKVIDENKGQGKNLISNIDNFSLKSLTAFYQKKAENYEELVNDNLDKNDYFFRKLFKEKALPFLEIESQQTGYDIKLSRREFRSGMKYSKIVEEHNRELIKEIDRDNAFISSILTLLYNNNGDYETRENEVIGDNFIKLWKEVRKKQEKNFKYAVVSRGKIKFIPYLDIVDELTKTLQRIKKPYDEIENQYLEFLEAST